MDSRGDDLQVLKFVQGIHAFLNTSLKKINDLQKAVENCEKHTPEIVESNVNNSENLNACSGIVLEQSPEKSKNSPKKNDLEIRTACSIKVEKTVDNEEVRSLPENQYFSIVDSPNVIVNQKLTPDENRKTDIETQASHYDAQLKNNDIDKIRLKGDMVNKSPRIPDPEKPYLYDALTCSEKNLEDSNLLPVPELTVSSDEEEEEASTNTPIPVVEHCLPRIRVSKNLHHKPLETVESPIEQELVDSEQAEVVEIFPDNFFSTKDVYQVKINFKKCVNVSEVEELLHQHTKLENIVDITVKNQNAIVSFADDINMRKAVRIGRCKQTLREMSAYKIQPVIKSLELLPPEVGSKRTNSKTPNGKKKKKRIFMAN